MALQSASPQADPTPQMVANAFVEQYYHILHHSPELVYRFYQDSSVLSRPNPNGGMSSISTMQGINEKILSMDFKNYKAEIKTADAQKSYKDGVTVLVTGCLTGNDNLKRKFAQSFFLAPQDVGYFVMNDMFRYLDHENDPVESINYTNQVSPLPERDEHPDPNGSITDRVVPVGEDHSAMANDVAVREVQIADEKENKRALENDTATSKLDESDKSLLQEEAPKKSYASIVKVAKGSQGPTKTYVPSDMAKGNTKKTENEPVEPAVPSPAPEASAHENDIRPGTGNANGEEGYSVYVRNLPFNTSVSELEAEFKKFGPIKKDGIQVRNNKQQGYCFGFVEYISQSSVDNAIQASPINILGCDAVIEAKRTISRGEGERGRYSYPRGGYRSESFRGRGNHGRGYGYGNWGNESMGRGRDPSRGGRGRSSSGPI